MLTSFNKKILAIIDIHKEMVLNKTYAQNSLKNNKQSKNINNIKQNILDKEA